MKVSIILATYNGSRYIEESIESVLKQTFSDFEFIIINDCSTDNTENIILKYQKLDNRIIYIKNNKNLKLTKSLNKGLKIAKGKYIARIDDDDIWEQNKLEKQVNFLEKNQEYGLCGSGMIIINEKGKELRKILMPEKDIDIRNKILIQNTFIHSSILIKKSVLDKVGKIYNEKANYVEDYELWLRIGKVSKFYNIPEYLIKYRFLETSISRKKYYKQRFNAFKIFIKNIKYYPKKITSLFIRIIKLFIPKIIHDKINF